MRRCMTRRSDVHGRVSLLITNLYSLVLVPCTNVSSLEWLDRQLSILNDTAYAPLD